jgi:hypothetical protein
MRVRYKPDPSRDVWVSVDVPVPRDILMTLDPDTIAEYVTRYLARQWAAARHIPLDDPRVLAYQQGQYDWVKAYLVEHVLAALENFRERVVMSKR